eukprot:tig00021464_g21709.t1
MMAPEGPVSYTQRLQLAATIKSNDPVSPETLDYEWRVSGSTLVLDETTIDTTSARNVPTLVIKSNILTPGATYVFSINIGRTTIAGPISPVSCTQVSTATRVSADQGDPYVNHWNQRLSPQNTPSDRSFTLLDVGFLTPIGGASDFSIIVRCSSANVASCALPVCFCPSGDDDLAAADVKDVFMNLVANVSSSLSTGLLSKPGEAIQAIQAINEIVGTTDGLLVGTAASGAEILTTLLASESAGQLPLDVALSALRTLDKLAEALRKNNQPSAASALPSAPQLSIVNVTQTSVAVTVSYPFVTSPIILTLVYRNGTLIATLTSNQTMFNDEDLISGFVYEPSCLLQFRHLRQLSRD